MKGKEALSLEALERSRGGQTTRLRGGARTWPVSSPRPRRSCESRLPGSPAFLLEPKGPTAWTAAAEARHSRGIAPSLGPPGRGTGGPTRRCRGVAVPEKQQHRDSLPTEGTVVPANTSPSGRRPGPFADPAGSPGRGKLNKESFPRAHETGPHRVGTRHSSIQGLAAMSVAPSVCGSEKQPGAAGDRSSAAPLPGAPPSGMAQRPWLPAPSRCCLALPPGLSCAVGTPRPPTLSTLTSSPRCRPGAGCPGGSEVPDGNCKGRRGPWPHRDDLGGLSAQCGCWRPAAGSREGGARPGHRRASLRFQAAGVRGAVLLRFRGAARSAVTAALSSRESGDRAQARLACLASRHGDGLRLGQAR